MTFDNGQVTAGSNNQYTDYYFGDGNVPALGEWIGYQDQSDDKKNPTQGAVWYSVPGACPKMPVTGSTGQTKTESCIKQYPSSLCSSNQQPDGVNCNYRFDFLGEVDVNHMVGIYDMGYSSYQQYCSAADSNPSIQKEFVRNPNTFEVESSFPFWADALNQTANALRIQKLIKEYNNLTYYPNNKPIDFTASIEALNKGNPDTSCITPDCQTQSCTWDANNNAVVTSVLNFSIFNGVDVSVPGGSAPYSASNCKAATGKIVTGTVADLEDSETTNNIVVSSGTTLFDVSVFGVFIVIISFGFNMM